MKFKLTNHAKEKINQRGIRIEDVEEAIRNPDKKALDRTDERLIHFIKKFQDRHLRVIVKTDRNDIIVVSAFYDRRLKRRQEHDQNKL